MSLFKKKDSNAFEDMDAQGQLKRIMEQLGFLEKKVDTVLEELRNRGGARPSFGGGPRPFNRDRGPFRGNRPRPEGGNPRYGGQGSRPEGGSNSRYGGQGPRRYSPGRPFGNDDNRGNYNGGRPEGMRGNHRPNHSRRPQQHNPGAPAAPPPQATSPEAQPE